jgi:hypothetical protein
VLQSLLRITSGYKKKAGAAFGRAGGKSFDFAQDRLCPYVV